MTSYKLFQCSYFVPYLTVDSFTVYLISSMLSALYCTEEYVCKLLRDLALTSSSCLSD